MEEMLKTVYKKLLDMENSQTVILQQNQQMIQEMQKLKKENEMLKLNVIIMNPNSKTEEKQTAMLKLYEMENDIQKREENSLPGNLLK